ncbi:C39 family peptidase [Corynebacterium ulcerans]|uniref:C39 family peptidase n=1 Tax=Corynebacterium ulcerans TaxID=65058 RepID=UPI0034A1E013
MEKILDYPRDQVRQDTFYNCGPASTQTIIRAATGKLVGETQLGGALRTHRGGTDYIGLFPAVLNAQVPGGMYRHRDVGAYPDHRMKEVIWAEITNSIRAGHGVVANIVAPPSNYPKAVAPSTMSPRYGGGTVYHYIAVMGYSDEGMRKLWIADSGFYPYGYWIGFDQFCSLIVPKGYAYSTAAPKVDERKEAPVGALTEKYFKDFITGFFGPVVDAVFRMEHMVKDIHTQLRGPDLKGWPQLGRNVHGENLTPVDGIAALRVDVAKILSIVEKREGK